jgi:hypothetical protein
MLIKYAGHLYREAQEPDTKPKAIDAIEQAKQVAAVEGSASLLAKYKLKTQDKPAITVEGDGIDVTNQLVMPFGIPMLMTFDFNLGGEKPKLQEAVAEMCRVGYVASSAVDIVTMLESFSTLASLTPSNPNKAKLTGKQQKNTVQAIEWMETQFPPVLAKLESLVGEFDLQNRQDIVKKLTDAMTKEKPNTLGNDTVVKQAIKILQKMEDEDWQRLVAFFQNARGRFTPSRQLVEQKVIELTQHEQYSGGAQILTYDKDRVVVGLSTPAPFEHILMAFRRTAGQSNAVQFVTAGFVLCGGKLLETGPDEAKFKQALTMMVNLVLLSQNAANPQYSPPPGGTIETDGSMTEQEFKAARAKSLFVLQYEGDVYKFEYRGKPGLPGGQQTTCLSADQYEEMWKQDALKNYLKTERVYVIDPTGDVFQLDQRGEPIDRLVYQIERKPGETCSA